MPLRGNLVAVEALRKPTSGPAPLKEQQEGEVEVVVLAESERYYSVVRHSQDLWRC